MEAADAATTPVEDLMKDMTNDNLLSLAKVAEAAERYPDMCRFMKKLVKNKSSKGEDLEVEERNLLSVAYKNVVGSKRSSWRTLASGNFTDVDKAMVDSYQERVEIELNEICTEVIGLLGPDIKNQTEDQKHIYQPGTLLKYMQEKNKQDETMVFYLKMVGDYCRYLAEINNQKAKTYTEHYYKEAYEVAQSSLAETHPTRLGLALNFSVCYYEIMKKPEKACDLAKKAFDGAIEKLDTLNDASYKDSTLIMQLLRDNLTLWTSEKNDGDEDPSNP